MYGCGRFGSRGASTNFSKAGAAIGFNGFTYGGARARSVGPRAATFRTQKDARRRPSHWADLRFRTATSTVDTNVYGSLFLMSRTSKLRSIDSSPRSSRAVMSGTPSSAMMSTPTNLDGCDVQPADQSEKPPKLTPNPEWPPRWPSLVSGCLGWIVVASRPTRHHNSTDIND